VFLFGNGNGKILGKGNELPFERRSQVPQKTQRPMSMVLPTGSMASWGQAAAHAARSPAVHRVDFRPSPVAGQQLDLFFGISGCFAPLFEPVFQHI
jgi:hypothetical protein